MGRPPPPDRSPGRQGRRRHRPMMGRMSTTPSLPPLLWLFALCNFVLGTGAFGMTGYLGPLAEDLGVSVGAAGQTMTAYALANALLAPWVMVATGRWPRRRVMLLALGLFGAGTVISAAAPHLGVLLFGRVLMGVGAVFTPVAAGVTMALVPPQQRGQALSRTFLGMSLSYVLGVPFGAWLGLAFGWQWPLWAVALSAGAMLVLVHRWVPRHAGTPGAGFQGLGRLLRQREIALTLLLTLLYFSAIFTVSAYMGPVQLALNPLSPTALTASLTVLGLAGVCGTLMGGWAADRHGPRPTLRWQIGVMALALALAPFTAGQHLLTLLAFGAMSVCGFGMMTPQQSRLAESAFDQAPMLLSLNASMVYIGTAAGAALGGAAIPWLGFERLSWIGAGFAALGALTLLPRWRTLAPPPRHTP